MVRVYAISLILVNARRQKPTYFDVEETTAVWPDALRRGAHGPDDWVCSCLHGVSLCCQRSKSDEVQALYMHQPNQCVLHKLINNKKVKC
jgi:hypothetical protein